jgi:hypothetical protein
MVTTEVGQLAGECTLWIDTLKSFRNKFTNYRNQLHEHSGHQTQQEVLVEVEHFYNQIHIQLINIHDLKQAIKRHVQTIAYERSKNNGNMSDDILAKHEYLYDEYQRLETTLHIISREFERFLKYIGV